MYLFHYTGDAIAEPGFAVSILSPADYGHSADRAASRGVTHVLVFDVDVSPADLQGGQVAASGGIRVSHRGAGGCGVSRFMLSRDGAAAPEPHRYPADACVWAGRVERCPARFRNPREVLDALSGR